MYPDLGLLIVRLVVGGLFIGHGAQKLFGWFGGHGIEGTAGWLRSIGLRPARFWATVAGLAEFAGGALFALGLLAPLGALAIIAVMLMAILLVHWGKGLWVSNGGSEYPLTMVAVALALSLTGPGRFSLDTALGLALSTSWVMLAALVAALAAGAALASRARTPVAAGQQ